METLHLIVTLAGERVALPVTHVGSVIEVEGLTPVPRAAPHIAGLTAQRSRVITLIDCRIALGLPPLAARPSAAPSPVREAVWVTIEGHDYGLIVDAVEDVLPACPAPASLGAGVTGPWARAAAGLVTAGGALLPALDPAALIAGAAGVAA